MAYVTRDQLRAAYDALGLDPERWLTTAYVLISSHTVTVVRYVHGQDVDGSPLTETEIFELASPTS